MHCNKASDKANQPEIHIVIFISIESANRLYFTVRQDEEVVKNIYTVSRHHQDIFEWSLMQLVLSQSNESRQKDTFVWSNPFFTFEDTTF